MLNRKVPTDRMISAIIADHLGFIAWSKTQDAQNNINRPPKIIDLLMGVNGQENDVQAFETEEDFRKAWNDIVTR